MTIATAVPTVVAAAGFFRLPAGSDGPAGGQSDQPAIAHEYAGVNGVRLHDVRAGRGPLMVFPDEVNPFIRAFLSSADPGKPRKP